MVSKKLINLKTTTRYPCQWDDLVDETNKTYATIYTLTNAKEDRLRPLQKPGITKNAGDGIYDIVINVPELTKLALKKAIKQLSKTTKVKYNLLTQKKA